MGALSISCPTELVEDFFFVPFDQNKMTESEDRKLFVVIDGLRNREHRNDLWDAIKKKLTNFGNIEEFDIPSSSYDRNYAFVTMDSCESARRARKRLNNIEINFEDTTYVLVIKKVKPTVK